MNKETLREEARRLGISVLTLKRRKQQKLFESRLHQSELELRERSAGWNKWAGSKGVRHG